MKFLIFIALTISAFCYVCHAQSGSCVGLCGSRDYVNDCDCTVDCVDNGNCCPGYQATCFTCNNRCNEKYGLVKPCQCNNGCTRFGDCCHDFGNVCNGTTPEGTCQNRCETAYDSTRHCQCLENCEVYLDCCADYFDLCDVATPAPPRSKVIGQDAVRRPGRAQRKHHDLRH